MQQEEWDFESREALPASAGRPSSVDTDCFRERHAAFINEVLDRYRQVGGGSPNRANVFTFNQMEVVLRRASD